MVRLLKGPLVDNIVGCSYCRKIITFNDYDQATDYIHCPNCNQPIKMYPKYIMKNRNDEEAKTNDEDM